MSASEANRRFESTCEAILQKMWEFYPNLASGMGLHDYDGRLLDISKAALSRRAQELEQDISALDDIDVSALGRQSYFDHKLLVSMLRKELFELTELRIAETNPMDMMWHIEFSNYIKRDYAPLEERIEALTNALGAVPSFISDLKTGLGQRISRAVLEASVESYDGLVAFYDKDLPEAVGALGDRQVKENFEKTRAGASGAIGEFVRHLESQKEHAIDDFAIGERRFMGLLKHGEMVDMPLDRLLEAGMNDLERNKTRFRELTTRIDPSRSPEDVMAEAISHHPTADSLVTETREMLEKIRQFLIDRDIVTLPSEERCQTRETPSFMRWAFAAMDMPGPFETGANEAFYYITPVENHWTDEQKEEWLTSFNYGSLQNISIHEAYPGHYIHYLHTRNAPSKMSKVFGAYSFWEGWAHYTEGMMIEEGYGAGDVNVHLGQLSDALLRDCRFICAIRMHTQGMAVKEATKFFMDNAYMEELPASKEASRGTFDPMYLNYTLGKLIILKLREDYRRENGPAFSLKKFHDTFLSFGAPPIPVVREMMLQEPGQSNLIP